MDYKSAFKTNKQKEVEGVWQPGPIGRYLVARNNNPNYTKLVGELTKPYRKLIQIGRMDDKLLTSLICEAMSRTILLGWQGLIDDGKEVPYSQAEAKKRLEEDEDFREFVSLLSQQMSVYQDEEREAATKNS